MGFLGRLGLLFSGAVPPADPRDHDIARHAYADFLRAQLIGFAPEEAETLADELLAGHPTSDSDGGNTKTFAALADADFPTIMGLETRLTEIMTDDQIVRNYWIVRDRLNRVGSSRGIREHDVWAPAAAMRDHDDGDASVLETARAAKTAALAMVGEASVALTGCEAVVATAGNAATDAQRAAVVKARKAVDTAIKAATDAVRRVTDLEAQQKSEQPGSPLDADGETPPAIDVPAMEHAAMESEAETQLAVQKDMADAATPAPEGDASPPNETRPKEETPPSEDALAPKDTPPTEENPAAPVADAQIPEDPEGGDPARGETR